MCNLKDHTIMSHAWDHNSRYSFMIEILRNLSPSMTSGELCTSLVIGSCELQRYAYFSIIDANLSYGTLAYTFMLWILYLSDICDNDIIVDYIISLLHEGFVHIFDVWVKLMKLLSFNYFEDPYLILKRVGQRNNSVIVA